MFFISSWHGNMLYIMSRIKLTQGYLKYLLCLFTLILIFPVCYGQYLISGELSSQQAHKTVYLSLLRYDEETLISENQVLFSTQTDEKGYFEFKGQLLSEKDQLYRIHANRDDALGLQLVNNPEDHNFYNFIFSNTDSIHFAKNANQWFVALHQSNRADKEWKKLKQFKAQFNEVFIPNKNKELQQQRIDDYAHKLQQFSLDSLKHPLVKLLSFAAIKRTDFDIRKDFEKNPLFYNDILQSLKKKYPETSYTLQFQDELSKITYILTLQRYQFHKNLNYMLAATLLLIAVYAFILYKKQRQKSVTPIKNEGTGLTQQEIKIANLIAEQKSNKEIADLLFISLSTVKTHIRNLYTKLEVNNRHELTEKFKNQPKD